MSDPTARPNILWICTDQQRFDAVGCYGNEWVTTPNIDRLAADGVLFEHAYSQSPVCTPSRASFLTGRYPRTTRCRQNGQTIPADEKLVTRLLADVGYTCGLSGKLHLSACNPRVTRMEERIDDGYHEFHWMHHPDPDWPTNEYALWLRERGQTYRREPFEGSRWVQTSMPEEHHPTTWCAQKAINFVEAHEASDSPWLFSVNPFDPHHAFDPPREYLERYLDRLDDIPPPNYTPGELDDKPVFQQREHHGAYNSPRWYPFAEMMAEDHRLVRAAYWAMCDLIDVQVGRMLDVLDRTGQRENTVVIFMSDHGEMLGDHGIYLKGSHFYDPAVRVPLVVSTPGPAVGGARSEALVELVDLAPTLLDAAGVERYAGMQGRSLWPLLSGGAGDDPHRDDVYCEYYNAMPTHKDPAAHATMVRTRAHKLVAMHGTQPGELYDLSEDPTETHNLWDSAAHVGVKAELLERLCDRMAWTVDPLPERRANF